MQYSQYVRREKIKRILRQRGRVTSKELAAELEVSKNTIVKDVNALTQIFPVSVEYGRKGAYIYIGDGSVELNERQTKYLCRFMQAHAAEAGDDMYVEVLNLLKSAERKE